MASRDEGSRASVLTAARRAGILLMILALTWSGAASLVLHAPPHPSGTGTREQALSRMWLNATTSGGAVPPLDYWASLAVDLTDRALVLFGGCGRGVCPAPAQTWTFAHGQWQNVTNRSGQPPERSYASLDYDSADGYVLLFGGVGTSSLRGDTWTYSRGTWTNRTSMLSRAPGARWGASMAYDPVERGLLLFGGMSASGSLLNDTWLYSGGTWRNLSTVVAPPSRYEAGLVWDAADSQAVLADGCGALACPLGDAWRFRGGAWTVLPSGGGPTPGPRTLAALLYDGATASVQMFGGIRNGTSLGDAWSYASGVWTADSPGTLPRPREGSAATESTELWASNGTPELWPYGALWGGDYVGCPTCGLQGLEDTWVFAPPLSLSVAVPAGEARSGADLAFSASASGGTPPFSYRWSFGDGGNAAGPNAIHAFVVGGRYSVGVIVTDDAGVQNVSQSVLDVSAASTAVPPVAWLGMSAAGIGALVAGTIWVVRKRRPPTT